MREMFVAKADQIPEGGRAFTEFGDRKIGVLRVKGKLHAFLNECPHQGGPVCDGLAVARVEDVIAPDRTYVGRKFSETDMHLVCPWHGWEFNIETGRCAGDGVHGLKRFKIVERGGDVYVTA